MSANGSDDEHAALSTALPGLAASARVARRFVCDALRRRSFREEVTETVTLLTSELVSNVVLHASGPLTVAVHPEPGMRVRVEVGDESSEPPVIDSEPDLEGTRGRGLLLVEAFADEWGVESKAQGKIIWFRVNG